jgi:site-specific recombinase XerD
MGIVEPITAIEGCFQNVPNNTLVEVSYEFMFSDLILRWLDSTRSIQTKRSYKNSIEDFFKTSIYSITFEMVRTVNIVDVQNYLDELNEKELKSSTIKTRLSACSSFYDYILSFKSNTRNIKLLNFNPFKNGIIKQEKAKKITKNDANVTETLTDEELKRLYQAIDTSKIKGIRDYAIIKVMLNGALRRSELVNLRIRDLYERNFEYWIHIEQGKGNKNRDNFINTDTVQAIERYLTSTGRSIKDRTDDCIFKGVSTNGKNGKKLTADAVKQLLEKYCSMAKITKRISPHSLRHKSVTTLLENNVKPEFVMEYCGHASVNTTMRYWHNMERDKNNAGRSLAL